MSASKSNHQATMASSSKIVDLSKSDEPVDSIEDIETPPEPAQVMLNLIQQYAKDQKFEKELALFVPLENVTFMPTPQAIKKTSAHLHNHMLFLGEDQDSQIWAAVKTYEAKPGDVTFLRVPINGDTVAQVLSLEDYPISPPLHVLVRSSYKHGYDRLKAVIKFVFLQHEEPCVPFTRNQKFGILEDGITRIVYGNKAFRILGDGTTAFQLPQMQKPSVLPTINRYVPEPRKGKEKQKDVQEHFHRKRTVGANEAANVMTREDTRVNGQKQKAQDNVNDAREHLGVSESVPAGGLNGIEHQGRRIREASNALLRMSLTPSVINANGKRGYDDDEETLLKAHAMQARLDEKRRLIMEEVEKRREALHAAELALTNVESRKKQEEETMKEVLTRKTREELMELIMQGKVVKFEEMD